MRTTPTGEPKTPQSGHWLFDFKQIVDRIEVWENYTTKMGTQNIIEQPHDTCQLSHYSKYNETAPLTFLKKYGLAFYEIVLNPWKNMKYKCSGTSAYKSQIVGYQSNQKLLHHYKRSKNQLNS